jgi:hypothetical protein
MPGLVIPDDGDAENGGCGGSIRQRSDNSAEKFFIKFFYNVPERWVSILLFGGSMGVLEAPLPVFFVLFLVLG